MDATHIVLLQFLAFLKVAFAFLCNSQFLFLLLLLLPCVAVSIISAIVIAIAIVTNVIIDIAVVVLPKSLFFCSLLVMVDKDGRDRCLFYFGRTCGGV